jgi:hypothetical protein
MSKPVEDLGVRRIPATDRDGSNGDAAAVDLLSRNNWFSYLHFF